MKCNIYDKNIYKQCVEKSKFIEIKFTEVLFFVNMIISNFNLILTGDINYQITFTNKSPAS